MSPVLLEAIIVLAAKYGPEIVTAIVALFKKTDPTLADIEKLFADVREYESFGIPDVAIVNKP